MSAVTALRPRPRPVPVRSARPASSPTVPVLDGPVSVEWDQARGLHVVACGRCAETVLAVGLDQAHTWAQTHCCDPEPAALLAQITGAAA